MDCCRSVAPPVRGLQIGGLSEVGAGRCDFAEAEAGGAPPQQCLHLSTHTHTDLPSDTARFRQTVPGVDGLAG